MKAKSFCSPGFFWMTLIQGQSKYDQILNQNVVDFTVNEWKKVTLDFDAPCSQIVLALILFGLMADSFICCTFLEHIFIFESEQLVEVQSNLLARGK